MKSPKLSNLLNIDKPPPGRAQAEAVLTDVFGDQALYQSNGVFRTIRNLAIVGGYRFSANTNSLYDALPLTQLEVIHKTKTIPYTPNRAAVEFVLTRADESTWEEIADGFRRCFVFHESCHAVARSVITSFNQQAKICLSLNNSELTFLSLLEESFANTCELIGIIDCTSPQLVAFYEANSYTALLESRHDLLQLQNEVGPDGFFRFIHLCYLQSCFLRNELSERDIKQTLTLAKLTVDDPRLRKRLRSVSNIAFTLDRRFREITTRLHLRINGLRSDLETLNPLEFFETSRGFLSLLDRLAISAKNS
ncbi:MAG: hypothetical protein J0L82_17225 [Deltaproteobacteria bacterium]|jgi:hypothetical protein|nr:hypothetical protein [Deltaproteobacteria bacterium]